MFANLLVDEMMHKKESNLSPEHVANSSPLLGLLSGGGRNRQEALVCCQAMAGQHLHIAYGVDMTCFLSAAGRALQIALVK